MTRTDIDNYQRSSVERATRLTPYARSEISRIDRETAELRNASIGTTNYAVKSSTVQTSIRGRQNEKANTNLLNG